MLFFISSLSLLAQSETQKEAMGGDWVDTLLSPVRKICHVKKKKGTFTSSGSYFSMRTFGNGPGVPQISSVFQAILPLISLPLFTPFLLFETAGLCLPSTGITDVCPCLTLSSTYFCFYWFFFIPLLPLPSSPLTSSLVCCFVRTNGLCTTLPIDRQPLAPPHLWLTGWCLWICVALKIAAI